MLYTPSSSYDQKVFRFLGKTVALWQIFFRAACRCEHKKMLQYKRSVTSPRAQVFSSQIAVCCVVITKETEREETVFSDQCSFHPFFTRVLIFFRLHPL